MPRLSRADLWSLEEYAERRATFRSEIIAHKKNRQCGLGNNARLYFEDFLTVRYQIQEMLRIEKVFEGSAINEELDAYNPLIPDGHNWKATFMIEYEEPAEREVQLTLLKGIEDKVWLQVEDCEPVYPIADEDLERENDEKTSSVHFLRWELSPIMISAVHNGAAIYGGVEHPHYHIDSFALPGVVRESLAKDLTVGAVN